jgi:hypothetical protein
MQDPLMSPATTVAGRGRATRAAAEADVEAALENEDQLNDFGRRFCAVWNTYSQLPSLGTRFFFLTISLGTRLIDRILLLLIKVDLHFFYCTKQQKKTSKADYWL